MKKFGFYFFTFCILVIAIGLGSLLGVYVFLKLISKNVTKKDLEDRENQIIQEAQKKRTIRPRTKPLEIVPLHPPQLS
ncbi:hypothetical protein [Flectobacillus sp. BAB-3569]|uniref:hypothetical protein n=1 Tax=Flectobacillus sp. BAB-3569 TaxID=1509483 RepID=UPI000BA2D9B9|nr:hypothetical protein [Flectobacillus sp. BAB-3569]PAC33319.1 hypothetical protein BWI92_02085 [Flectobacillus sp. BAB-3569]